MKTKSATPNCIIGFVCLGMSLFFALTLLPELVRAGLVVAGLFGFCVALATDK